MHPMISLVLGRRSEIAIEFVPLLGRQHGTHARARLQDGLVALMLEFSAHRHNLRARLADDLQNLRALVRRQIQVTLHAVEEASVRRPQPSAPVRQVAHREADRQA